MSQKFKNPVEVDGQVSAEYLDLSTTTTHSVNAGEIAWNSVDGTFDIGLLNGVTLQAGQEMHFYGKATEAISNGNAVMFAGVQGDHLLIAKADAATISANPEYFMGVATQDFTTNQFGYVTAFGNVRGLNTTGYTLGSVLYYDSTTSTDGLLTATMPSAPNAKILVAAVVRVHATQGILMVRPHTMPQLKDIQDVNTSLSKTTPIDADSLLLQDSANSNIWKKLSWSNTKATLKAYFDTIYQSVLTNPITGTGTTNYVSKFTGATSLGNSQIFDNGTNVGIGTSSPQRKLEVRGDHTTSTFRLYYSDINVVGQDASVDMWASEPELTYNGSGIGSNVNGQPIYGRTNPALGQTFLRFINGNMMFHTSTGDAVYAERMRIDSNGNVGIGTTTPVSKLHVVGSGNPTIRLSGSDSAYSSILELISAGAGQSYIGATNILNLVTNSAERLTILANGNVGIGTTSPLYRTVIQTTNQTIGLSVTTNANDTETGLYVQPDHTNGIVNLLASGNSNKSFGFLTGNTERMRITSTGNVGIGTSAPSSGLQINRSSWGITGANVSRMLQKNIGAAGDYEQHVILLHPIYNGSLIAYNKCSGSIYASRGGTSSGLINDTYNIDTASAYNSYNGTINSTIGYGRLYTCDYNGVKYLALLPDYRTSAVQYNFDGYVKSTGEELKLVVYRMSNSGTIVNSEVYNSLTEYGAGTTHYQGNVYTAGSFVGNLTGTADQSSVTFSNSGTTFYDFYDSQINLTDKNYLIYNTTDAPRGTLGLYTVSMNKWYGDYGSMFAIDCEPGQGIGYIKSKYGGTWGSWKMLIDNASTQTIGGNKNFTNNLGIGTTSPSGKLDTYGDGYFGKQDYSYQAIQKVLTLRGDAVSGVFAGNSYRMYVTPGALSAAQKLSIRAEYNGTESSDLMTILGNGNVGIGTTSPSKLLDVNGDALINGLTVGKGGGNISTNTALGNGSLFWNSSGDNNTSLGYVALSDNETGSYNTAVGTGSLAVNNDKNYNTAVGWGTLQNVNRQGNTVVGFNINLTPSGVDNIDSDGNLAIGQYNEDFGFQQVPHIYAPPKIYCQNSTITDVLTIDFGLYSAAFLEYSIFNSDGDQFRAGRFVVAFKSTGTPEYKDFQEVIYSGTTSGVNFTVGWGGATTTIQLDNTEGTDYYIRFTSRLLMR